MIFEDDKKAIEEIVESTLKKMLDDTGIKEAMETINDSKKITKKEIMAVKDRTERQKLIEQNMELFE